MVNKKCSVTRSLIITVVTTALVGPCALAVLALLSAEVLSAQTYSVIHNFTGTDGAFPFAGLTMDRAGNLYGTTERGGFAGSVQCGSGCGTVYRVSRSSNGWTTTILHAFKGPPADGAGPSARVIFGPDRALYGTTAGNGTAGFLGTVFRLSPPVKSCGNLPCPWDESHYRFPADYLSGAEPLAEVTFDSEGNLYGTTDLGGPNYCPGPGACGVVFKVTTPIQEWNQSVIWDFEQSSGDKPFAGVTFDASGNMFGVTTRGGSADLGTFYEMTESAGSWTHSVLYNFTGQSDGSAPDGKLLEDAQGNFYGTAATGGSGGGGTVFEFSPSGSGWNLSVLHSFTGTEGPVGGLTMDANGNLYGTTFSDGAFGFGNVFKLTKSNGSWNYASLHDFSGGADGRNSYAVVQIDAAGNVYGTAVGGGATGAGVVWEITP